MSHRYVSDRSGRRGRSRTPVLAPALVLLAAAALSGCSGASTQDVTDAASRFEQAVTADRGLACDMLAPETRKELEDSSKSDCPSALKDADLPQAGDVKRAEIDGHSAQVVLSGDTLFLALFDDGWRVTAAGCEAQQGDDRLPYDCSVKGS